MRKKISRVGLDLPPHPNNIKPLGNALLVDSPHSVRNKGLGAFSVLSDELLLHLFSTFPPECLLNLGQCSKVSYIWTSFEELWRALYVSTNDDFEWFGSWKGLIGLRRKLHSPLLQIDIYSDVLFSSYRNSSHSLEPFLHCTTRPIPRESFCDPDTFHQKFSKKSIPVIITDVLTQWPLYQSWDFEAFIKQHGNVKFRAEEVYATLDEYIKYMNCNNDEAPLYLFDAQFGNVSNIKYVVPKYFQQDLFQFLGDSRPEYKWLIIGGKRSGSSFHTDPNGTSAWNAVLQGRKKWIMFKPGHVPPGIFLSEDASEVSSPLSVAEWLCSWYDQIKGNTDVYEGICEAGEIMYVPSGWFHLVVNLDDSTVALTQNFVDDWNLSTVLEFLKNKKDQISGIDDASSLYDNFLEKLGPDMIKQDLVKTHKQSLCEANKSEPFAFNFL